MRLETALLVAVQALHLFFLSQTPAAQAQLTPFIPNTNNGSCTNATCGQGTCEASDASIMGLIAGHTCRCNPGWTQLVSHIKFLPCVIPNCTTNISCSEDGSAPAPSHSWTAPNSSIFDPCSWAVCGGGECVKISAISHRCDCRSGYYNLMNNTLFPCFRKCALSADCSQLGIRLPGSPPPPPPPSSSLGTPPPSKGPYSPPDPSDTTPPSKALKTRSTNFLLWLAIHPILLDLFRAHGP